MKIYEVLNTYDGFCCPVSITSHKIFAKAEDARKFAKELAEEAEEAGICVANICPADADYDDFLAEEIGELRFDDDKYCVFIREREVE